MIAKQSGLTLFELLISMVIIAICVFSIALMFQQALRGSPNVKSLTIATALSEEAMERALAQGFNISSSGTQNFTGFPGYIYQIDVYNVDDVNLSETFNYSTGYKVVNITVKYGSNYSRNITTSSLLTNYTD